MRFLCKQSSSKFWYFPSGAFRIPRNLKDMQFYGEIRLAHQLTYSISLTSLPFSLIPGYQTATATVKILL